MELAPGHSAKGNLDVVDIEKAKHNSQIKKEVLRAPIIHCVMCFESANYELTAKQ